MLCGSCEERKIVLGHFDPSGSSRVNTRVTLLTSYNFISLSLLFYYRIFVLIFERRNISVRLAYNYKQALLSDAISLAKHDAVISASSSIVVGWIGCRGW